MKRLLALPALLALALGCAGPVSAPASPSAPLPPPAFSAGGSTSAPDRWWLAFEDPALHGLVEAALAGNLDLAQAWDRLRLADAGLAAAGAPLLPTLDGELGARRSRSRTETPQRGGGTQTGHDSATDLSLGLAARYELDLWGALRAGREAARADRRASSHDLQAAAITIAARVAGAWFALVEQRGQLALLEAQRQTNAQVLELLRLRFDHGQAAAADVLRQEQLVEAAQGEAAQVQAEAAALGHELALLLGLAAPGYRAPAGEALAVLPSLPATGLPAALIARRPDVRSAAETLAAADHRLAAAVAEQYPRLALRLGYDASAERLRDLFDNWLASLAAELAAPLLDGGRRRAEVSRQAALRDQRLHAWGQAVLAAFREVEDALAREARQRERLSSLERQVELAAGALERIREQYEGGVGDYLNVLDGLRRHQELERTRLRARRELLDLRVGLYRALAGGWDMEPEDRT